jgi:hypothetical protein
LAPVYDRLAEGFCDCGHAGHGSRALTLCSRENNRAFYEKAGFRYAGPELHRVTD